MTTRRALAPALLFVAAFATSGRCVDAPIIGDDFQGVDIRNSTGVTVVVYEDGLSRPPNRQPLAPNQAIVTEWMISEPKGAERQRERFEVAARNLQGELLFCKRFSYASLEELHWLIEVVSGQITCPERVKAR